MDNLNDVLGKISEFLKSEAKAETIIGQQFKLGDYTCVPVMRIGIGFGGATGEGKGNAKSIAEGMGTGLGSGGGVGMGPVGFLVTKGSEIEFIPVSSGKGLSAAFAKLPELLENFIERNKKKETAEV
ncbi:MAG: GerW family sporulation protein [Bacteroidia bacterium]